MNFTVSSSLLSSRLQTISRVINSKNTIPVLDCILFELKDNVLTLTASDPDNTLNTSILLRGFQLCNFFENPYRLIKRDFGTAFAL